MLRDVFYSLKNIINMENSDCIYQSTRLVNLGYGQKLENMST